MTSYQEREIERIQNNMWLYDNSINRNPNDDNAFFCKSLEYEELFMLTNDGEYNNLRLECLTQAIELTEFTNPLYIARRSVLHLVMGNKNLALSDINRLASIDMEHINPCERMYVELTIPIVLKGINSP